MKRNDVRVPGDGHAASMGGPAEVSSRARDVRVAEVHQDSLDRGVLPSASLRSPLVVRHLSQQPRPADRDDSIGSHGADAKAGPLRRTTRAHRNRSVGRRSRCHKREDCSGDYQQPEYRH
jgi:hypothetical protein